MTSGLSRARRSSGSNVHLRFPNLGMNTTVIGESAKVGKGVRLSGHGLRIWITVFVAFGFVLAIAVYGADYYRLGLAERALHPKHSLLRPSGTLGLRLGMLGFALFVCVYLYPLRKKWSWLARFGQTKRWLDFHALLGISAPAVITLHSTFKFQGLAGVAYWLMVLVMASGIAGRYLYAKIPRRLNSAEMDRRELEQMADEVALRLESDCGFSRSDIERVFPIPKAAEVEEMTLVRVILAMLWIDVVGFFQATRLRRMRMNWRELLRSVGGLLASGNQELESAIRLVRQRVRLETKIAFLNRSQRVFHLWHVVHRPFSYSFVLLASIHVIVMMMLGYY